MYILLLEVLTCVPSQFLPSCSIAGIASAQPTMQGPGKLQTLPRPRVMVQHWHVHTVIPSGSAASYAAPQTCHGLSCNASLHSELSLSSGIAESLCQIFPTSCFIHPHGGRQDTPSFIAAMAWSSWHEWPHSCGNPRPGFSGPRLEKGFWYKGTSSLVWCLVLSFTAKNKYRSYNN